jgi:hypothetical protein
LRFFSLGTNSCSFSVADLDSTEHSDTTRQTAQRRDTAQLSQREGKEGREGCSERETSVSGCVSDAIQLLTNKGRQHRVFFDLFLLLHNSRYTESRFAERIREDLRGRGGSRIVVIIFLVVHGREGEHAHHVRHGIRFLSTEIWTVDPQEFVALFHRAAHRRGRFRGKTGEKGDLFILRMEQTSTA